MNNSLKTIFTLSIILAGFAVQAQAPKGYKMPSNNIPYKMHFDNKSVNAKAGDILFLNFVLKTEKDSVLRSTFEEGNPMYFPFGEVPFKGSLSVLSPGDSATFLVSSDSLFGANIPPFIRKGSQMAFTIKLIKTLTDEQYKLEQAKVREEQAKIAADQASTIIAKEDSVIQEYLKVNNLKGTKTSSGLYYVQTTAGTGEQAERGKTVSVHYTGKLLNGTKFDSSVDRGTPFEFALGAGQVIRGWDEGIALMKVGEKGTLVIPSPLGYGSRGAGGAIPANAILIFDVELLGLK